MEDVADERFTPNLDGYDTSLHDGLFVATPSFSDGRLPQ